MVEYLGQTSAESSISAVEFERPDDWGSASGIAMRLTFFSDKRCDIPLEILRNFLRVGTDRRASDRSALTQRLIDPIKSMHEDIVTPPFATDDKLPLVILCEAFDADLARGEDSKKLRPVSIEIKPTVSMDWEARRPNLTFREDERFIDATLVDSFCIFENGSIAYCVSFVFDSLHNKATSLPVSILLVLESAWGESAGTWVTENPVTISLEGGERTSLQSFLHQRLTRLKNETEQNSSAEQLPSVFDLLTSKGETDEPTGLRELHDTLATFFSNKDRDGDKTLKPVSIGLELIGLTEHQEILDCAENAGKRQAKADGKSKMLAGLIQNIFDYTEQDDEEVNDSLSSRALIGTDISFANRGVAIRFREASRPYMLKRLQIGGSPYWMLVELVAGHNKVLLRHLLESERRINDTLRQKGESRTNTANNLDNLREQQEQIDGYIPNIFRYPTERELYGLFARAWDLDAQHGILRQSQQVRELKIRRDDEVLKERESIELNRRLLALSVIQVGGAIAAIAAVQAPDRQWAWPASLLVIAWGVAILILSWLGRKTRS